MKKEQSVVIAIKGGVERSFTEQVWKEMPADKYGWMPKVEEPEEVTEAKADTKAPAQATEAKKPEADKPKTVEKVNSKKH